MIVCLDGIDATGKSTQANILFQKLSGSKVLIHYPDYEISSGKLIQKELHLGTLDPFSLCLLFEVNRRQRIDYLIRGERNEINVCLDRYWMSAISYAEPRITDDQLVILGQIVDLLPKPDLCFILDIDPVVALKRMEKGRELDSFEAKLDYQRQVRESFLRQANLEGWIVLDATQSEEKLSDLIWAGVVGFQSSRPKFTHT